MFVSKFLSWVESDASSYLWLESQETVREIVGLLCVGNKDILFDGLYQLESELYSTSFDRQVRYPLYLKDKAKAMVIGEVLKW